jgi:L-alanine-DL-glutamate epimerase-like enolase superfamily enzyme
MQTRLHAHIEKWERDKPLTITGYTFPDTEVLVVSIERDGLLGRGEAGAVYYHHETSATLLGQISSARPAIEAGIGREELLRVLPAGAARSAVDQALWELEAKESNTPVWELMGLGLPAPALTTFTCGADAPEEMANVASHDFHMAKAIKLKLNGDAADADRVRAVHLARPDVWLSIDANQGLTSESLVSLLPTLKACNVRMIEQPFPIGQDHLLDGLNLGIPVSADESFQSLDDLVRLAPRYDLVNIKLSKCGGLTTAMELARTAKTYGLDLMIGCMGGTSLSMAPALILSGLCSVVDLDGPPHLKKDREPGLDYSSGYVQGLERVWGIP